MHLGPNILSDLPLGIESETTFIVIIAQLVLALWAIFLLLAGNIFDRAAVGTFFMAVGLLLGWFTAAAFSLWLMLLLAFVILAAGLALYFYSPRVAVAIAMFWPLPAIYFAHLYFTGSFSGNPRVGLGLLAAGRDALLRLVVAESNPICRQYRNFYNRHDLANAGATAFAVFQGEGGCRARCFGA
ncbi:hypothetical protein EDS67_27325 [candidate division KSB1 bacterium]|nr:MAG: hypothetical protein EDS67_27325 [candidate division KSB1 bacterium]